MIFNSTLFNKLLYKAVTSVTRKIMLLGDFSYIKKFKGSDYKVMENQDFKINEGDDNILEFYMFDENGSTKDVTGYKAEWFANRYNRSIYKSTDNSNVIISTSKVQVVLDSLDTIDYDGIYTHELRITDTNNKALVASSGTMAVLRTNSI